MVILARTTDRFCIGVGGVVGVHIIGSAIDIWLTNGRDVQKE